MLQHLVAALPKGVMKNGEAPLVMQLEAVSAERDFFRERYTAQIDEMDVMKCKLKESQRVIQRLRDQILERETGIMREQQDQSIVKAVRRKDSDDGGSSNTSVTSATCCEEESSSGLSPASPTPEEEVEENVIERDSADTEAPCAEVETGIATEQSARQGEDFIQVPVLNNANEEEESEEESEDESDEEDADAEAEKIRANAAKMLIWANYQTARPRTSGDDDDGSSSYSTPIRRSGGAPAGSMTEPPHNAALRSDYDGAPIIQSLPSSLIKPRNLAGTADDGSSSLESNSRSWKSSAYSGSGGTNNSRFGNIMHNLREIMDPQEDDASSSDDENSGR